uniref:VHS domain-containing protein n=1 Tax=Varanus komodoensis TaxID=61221 RepID=A0A8D2J937_VARKO
WDFSLGPEGSLWDGCGRLIEKATFGTLWTEEWDQCMHSCDLINTAEDGRKDAIRAFGSVVHGASPPWRGSRTLTTPASAEWRRR